MTLVPFARSEHTTSRWSLRPQNVERARELSQRLNLHPAVARVLAARGWESADSCAEFLSPRLANLRDPFELAGIEAAVDRTLRAIRAGEKIAIYGDYDVDGICSTALMALALRFLGADPQLVIPHRVHDGYGMNIARVEELALAGVTLLVTVDTGITAVAEIKRAAELGIDVIVTDHHIADAELPEACAIVNPNRADAYYDGGRLCGVGVAFKFAHALLKRSGRDSQESRNFLKELLDLVALGTIADVVPLLDENRLLAHFGLQFLASSRRPGIRALINESGIKDKALRPDHVGYVLAPRINAAGRTEDPRTALELILTDDPVRATELAKRLNALNQQRRDQEAQILNDCLAQANRQLESGEDSLLVVAGEDFHLGVVGIVAARLVERFHRPAIVLRVEPELAKGSARSIPGFDVHEALGACTEHLITFGGHAAAAGLQLAPASLGVFRSAINQFAAEVFRQRDLSPEVIVDAPVEPHEIDWRFYNDLQRMQPFGQENPQPAFMLRGACPLYPPRIVGSDHLKVTLKAGGASFSAIGFNLGRLLTLCESTSLPVDVLFRPMENTFNGTRKLELELLDLRPAAA